MSTFDYPSISVDQRTNEQNMSSIRAWSMQTVDQLNYLIEHMQDEITNLRNELNELKGDK